MGVADTRSLKRSVVIVVVQIQRVVEGSVALLQVEVRNVQYWLSLAVVLVPRRVALGVCGWPRSKQRRLHGRLVVECKLVEHFEWLLLLSERVVSARQLVEVVAPVDWFEGWHILGGLLEQWLGFLDFFGELLALFFVELRVAEIAFLLVAGMRFVTVDAELAALLECEGATVDAACVRVLVGVRELVLLQILCESKPLLAVFALVFLLLAVHQHVSFK